MLSFPSKLRPTLKGFTSSTIDVSGTTEAIVQSILAFARSALTATLPKNVVTKGLQSPHTGSLSSKHTISVPLSDPSSESV